MATRKNSPLSNWLLNILPVALRKSVFIVVGDRVKMAVKALEGITNFLLNQCNGLFEFTKKDETFLKISENV